MRTWLPVLCMALALPAQADSLKPMRLAYDVAWGSTPLGSGTLTLEARGGDCYHYALATRPIGIVRWTYGAPREDSEFCVVEGQVVPSAMQFSNPRRGKDGFVLRFDFAGGQVLGGRNGSLGIKPGTLDRLSVHQAARLWVKAHINDREPGTLITPIADHKRVKSYTFALRGRAEVKTAAGVFDAVRFERIDDPRTTLRFWLAPSLDYMPVKVEQIEDGDPKVNLSLRKPVS